PNDPINQSIVNAPVDSNSATMLNALGVNNPGGHPAFGSDPLSGFPYTVVDPRQPRVTITSILYGVENPINTPFLAMPLLKKVLMPTSMSCNAIPIRPHTWGPCLSSGMH